MQLFSSNPNAVYRKVDLDARIEASANADLTRICLEEVISFLGQALSRLERHPAKVPHDALSKAHGIILWLNRNIAPENPLRSELEQFYGGQAAVVRNSMTEPDLAALAEVRGDFSDLLAAAREA